VKFKKHSIILILILALSFFLRIYKIDNLSLFGDEIDVGYQAFSLMKTGKDYKGNLLPTYIESLSESRAPLLLYLSIPGVKLFGLNELGVRITPIIFGILSIFVFYKLILLLSKSPKLALISAFILSFNPWHFHYSRSAFEVTLLLFLTLLGTYLFYRFIKENKNKFLYFSIFSFALTFYTYNTANIFVPLLVIFLLLTNIKTLKKNFNPKNLSIAFLLSLVLVLPLLIQIFTGSAANRFKLISIFNNQDTINTIVEKRTSFSALENQKIERLFHNKLIAFKYEFFRNYLESFSPNFLFTTGDTSNIRHSVPGFGLLFISFIPFLIIGLLSLDLKKEINKIMLFALFIAPISAALTIQGGHHPTRLFFLIFPLSYFIALGAFKLLSSPKLISKLIVFAFTIALLSEAVLYSHEYFVHYPKDSFEYWNYGYKELFSNLPQNTNNYFISNRNYNSLLPFIFYQNYHQNTALEDKGQEKIIFNLNAFNLEDNDIYFINDWGNQDVLEEVQNIAQSKDTFLLFQGKDIPGDLDLSKEPLEGFKTISTIYYPNNTIFAQSVQKL